MEDIRFEIDNPEEFRRTISQLNFKVYFELDIRMRKHYQIQLLKGFSESLGLKEEDDVESKKYIIRIFLNKLIEEFDSVDNYELSALARDSIRFIDDIPEWI